MEKENCGCFMHGHCNWMHMVIKIAVALIIFWAGVQFGELKAILHGGYGNYRTFSSHEGGFNMIYRGSGAAVIPITSTTTTKK